MILNTLYGQKLIDPPKWLISNTQHLTIMGSQAYGTSQENSDEDVYGWCIPPKEMLFPHIAGYIPGFGKQPPKFEVWQQHHIKYGEKEFDFQVYSIVKYVQLAMEGNPNIVDSLFTPINCIKFNTISGEMLRENRKLFLSKECTHKTIAYAYSQIHKTKQAQDCSEVVALRKFEEENGLGNPTYLQTQEQYEDAIQSRDPYMADIWGQALKLWSIGLEKSKRFEDRKLKGVDSKFLGHTIRLLLQAEQILTHQDLDLQRNKDIVKDVRRGNWTLERVQEYFQKKEGELGDLKQKSALRQKPDEAAIKAILLEILNRHYQEVPIDEPDKYKVMVDRIKEIIH